MCRNILLRPSAIVLEEIMREKKNQIMRLSVLIFELTKTISFWVLVLPLQCDNIVPNDKFANSTVDLV